METEQTGKIRIVRVLDQTLCISCNNAYVADVLMSSGQRKKMIYCSRLDCDNWITESEN